MTLVVLSCGCEDLRDREPLAFVVDADRVVRASTVRVELVIEGQSGTASNVWDTLAQPTFKPDPTSDADWPLRFMVDPSVSTYARFSVIATARDAQRSVVARAQNIREVAEIERGVVRLHFDTGCFRQSTLCDEGFTCADGACVDAAAAQTAPEDATSAAPEERDRSEPPAGVADEGSECVTGERACAGHASRMPLACEAGLWLAQALCTEDQRCDTRPGPDQGKCLPIAADCLNREPGVSFCSADDMLSCVDLVIAERRPCGEHERCVPEADRGICDCVPGFVKDANESCREATECAAGNGGCDPQTQCSMASGEPTCSACPSGYAGTGDEGCSPNLLELAISAGVLEPEFSPDVRKYRVRLPALVQTLSVVPTVPLGSSITFDGAPVAPGAPWTSPVLPLGPTRVELVVTSSFGVASNFVLELEREGQQRAYIKAPNAELQDQFGWSVALSGDTLVATAWFEDSSATGIDADMTSNGATESGAAYVYVRRDGTWSQQAYLKPSDVSPGDYFGVISLLQGDLLVIGALHEAIYATGSARLRPGAAYVYTRNGETWSETARLSDPNATGADLFGMSLALDDDTLVIGAGWESTGVNDSGAAFVFEREASGWTQKQMLKSSVPSSDSVFGAGVAIDGDTLVVGASDDDARKGSAEIFVRRAGSWESAQRLQPPDLGGEANFGFSVAVLGDRIAIGAPYTQSSLLSTQSTLPGEVYIFDRDGDAWHLTEILRGSAAKGSDQFGIVVRLSESSLLVGASGDSSGATGIGGDPTRTDQPFAGAVYLFAPTPQGYLPTAFIKPHNPHDGDAFGYSLAFDGSTLAVGATLQGGLGVGIDQSAAPNSSTTGSVSSGAVYVFE